MTGGKSVGSAGSGCSGAAGWMKEGLLVVAGRLVGFFGRGFWVDTTSNRRNRANAETTPTPAFMVLKWTHNRNVWWTSKEYNLLTARENLFWFRSQKTLIFPRRDNPVVSPAKSLSWSPAEASKDKPILKNIWTNGTLLAAIYSFVLAKTVIADHTGNSVCDLSLQWFGNPDKQEQTLHVAFAKPDAAWQESFSWQEAGKYRQVFIVNIKPKLKSP